MARPLTIRQLSEEILGGPSGEPLSDGRWRQPSASKSLIKLPNLSVRSEINRPDNLPDLSHPYLVPLPVIRRSVRKAPLVVRVNRLLQIALVVCCVVALLGYGLDVAVSNDVTRLSEKVRRISEENAELSAQLLKTISFQGIQENALGSVGLRVPEQVLIVKEVQPAKAASFKPSKNYLPIMSGY